MRSGCKVEELGEEDQTWGKTLGTALWLGTELIFCRNFGKARCKTWKGALRRKERGLGRRVRAGRAGNSERWKARAAKAAKRRKVRSASPL